MPPVYTIATSDDRQPYHIANNSSSNNSVVTLQRAPSLTAPRSNPTPQFVQSQVPYDGDTSNSQPVTSQDLRRRPSTEGVANLNRWSRSTASSRETVSAQLSSSRRMSFGGSGTFNFGISEQEKVSPKRLQKGQPSTGNSPARQTQTTRPFEASANPVLPPIITLPSLQAPTNNTTTPLTPSPSTAGLLSAAVRSTVPDYFSSWDSTPKDFSQKKTESQLKAAGTEPSPISGPISVTNGTVKQGPGEAVVKGHSRNRSKGSGGTNSSQNSKPPSQKAMLSKALQKANTAVLLDNAQNFDGAMEAYSEACALLQQVMLRSSGDDDRRKLEAIRNTYTSRISELKKITPELHDDGKALPARPESGNYKRDELELVDDEEEPAIIETATATRIVNDPSYVPSYQQSRTIPPSQVPKRRESLLPSALDAGQYRTRTPQEPFNGRSFSKSPMQERALELNFNLAPPMESQYMPPPLSPGRAPPSMAYGPPGNNQDRQQSSDLTSANLTGPSLLQVHKRVPSNESMSWLDTIDESGGSTASSVHSRTSSMGVRRKHIRAASGATEAEFDAALDAAVEAAYDDGFEPMGDPEPNNYDYDNDDEIVANVRRKVELAKEKVRQSEREAAIQDAREKERKRRFVQQQKQMRQNTIDDEYDANESEEEERMLEEMTRDYVMDDFEFGLQSKSALPRESDSSGFSGRTWNSSIGSNPTTAGTMLSTVTEAAVMPQIPSLQSKTSPPFHPPPVQALPSPPNTTNSGSLQTSASQGVRSRRLSGQNAKQLKIETSKVPGGPHSQPPSMPPPRIPNGNDSVPPKTAILPQQRQPLPAITNRPPMPQSVRQASSPFPAASPPEIVSPPTPTLTQTFTNDSDLNAPLPRSGSPGRPQSRGLRKNFSSSSLKNMKSRNLSVSMLDDGSDVSPLTPVSSRFNDRDLNGRLPAMPALPTPIAAAFKDKMNGAPTGGLYLFNSDFHSPDSPGSPNPLSPGAPISLEPCPTESLLRPFWLMRALYQTLAHPRGGYLSTKLFVPRDVWLVKGVKLKNVEDKIANCDYLTAALLKLAQVDTFDADAVLEEMQSLEGVLEQVQATLTKKLGSEVGVQGSGGMFKDAPLADGESGGISKSGSLSSKSSSFSWRRLRSKQSGAGLVNTYSNKATSAEVLKEGLVMGTLPMTTTALSKVRFTKRDVTQVQFSGPNANYMGSLARLFDSAQALDQIARQVEDPGLRHADKTQVGLELCTRQAAEFFGFYICRFVLTDIAMLLDKFIKRGSEWVLV